MASRSKTSFEKRRKEVARKEKQKLKLERRAQRKLAKEQGIVLGPEMGEFGEGLDLDEGNDAGEGDEAGVEVQPVEAVKN